MDHHKCVYIIVCIAYIRENNAHLYCDKTFKCVAIQIQYERGGVVNQYKTIVFKSNILTLRLKFTGHQFLNSFQYSQV